MSADAVAAAAAAEASRTGRGRFQAAKRALSIKLKRTIGGVTAAAAGSGGAGGAPAPPEKEENHVRAGAIMAVKPHSLKIKREALKRSAAEASNVRHSRNYAAVQAVYVPERDPKYIMAWQHTLHNLEASGDDPKLLDADHFERFLDAMTGHISSIKGQHGRLSSWVMLAARCGALGFLLLLIAASTNWWIHSAIVDVAMPQREVGGTLGWGVGGGPLRANATTMLLVQGWGAFATSGDAFTTRSVPEHQFCLAL